MKTREQIKQMLVDTLMEVVTTVFSTVPTINEKMEKGEFDAGCIFAFIGLVGNLQGNIVVSGSEKSASAAVSKMLNCKSDISQQDVFDGMGEFTNVLAGGLKKKASSAGYGFNFSLPTVIYGESGFKVVNLGKMEVIKLNVYCADFELNLRLSFFI
ncbi:MAG: chemotaxis protein CheX [Candidatus Omnitrophica bacterium]|nr:chemotaxis protein CheX [Candidatus Omnitrophota bacterium]